MDDEVVESPGVTDEEVLALAAMVESPVTLRAIAMWFTSILRSGDVPEDWGRAVMVILPKVHAPQTVKDVRPIAMGSAVGKLFSRILLNRAMGIVQHESAVQCAGTGRQTTDYPEHPKALKKKL